MTVRVVVADDQHMVRAGLVRLLELQPGIDVVGQAADGKHAIELVDLLHPEVALLDIRMPAMDGIEATRRITANGTTRVVILTTFDLDEYVLDALRAGASGFLLKDSAPEQLVTAVHAAADGNALIEPSITRRLLTEFLRRPRTGGAAMLGALTPRERDVFLRVARGMSNAEIAGELYLGEATIKTHVSSALAKLGLRDRIHAVVFAYENGLINPGDNQPPTTNAAV
jgi:DNA-binding NarL/FixJ family response regulator